MNVDWSTVNRVIARELRVSEAHLETSMRGPPARLASAFSRTQLQTALRILQQYGVQLQAVPFVNELVAETQRIKGLAQERSQQEERSGDEAKKEPARLSEVPSASPFEEQSLAALTKLGFSEKRTLQVLRECNGDVMRAKSRLLEDLRDYQDMKQMDQSRELSEVTARADEARADKDRRGQLSYTDVLSAGVFKNSMLLDHTIGVPVLREILCVERDGAVDLTHAELRDSCIKLLGLESRCFKWFGVGTCAYISQVIRRMRKMHPEEFDLDYLSDLANELNAVIVSMPDKAGNMPAPFVKALYEVSDLSDLQRRCGDDCFLSGKTLPSMDDDDVVVEDEIAAASASGSNFFFVVRGANESLSWNNIGPVGSEKIAKALEVNRSLESLRSLRTIATAVVQSSLKKLDLGFNGIVLADMTAIARMLEDAPLVDLNLSNNVIGPRGAIAEVIQTNQKLLHLK
ncbi:NLR family CARD domain-containing protein 3 [Hondaea fermentalgiana]|uniref:NLR family CARD domain-containing protein 3 n=1 Tax=Hondaea fermentalgiana TaxID=2315210 RepID=A0A2R5GGY8_9STRA|nr:NLR family CARD domain-containing protein 3 [Hondaea fermentalgiana]|eukprot:GBG30152.1 NLR family CARD domain-containing protein 3 [Hondaea fermentalgiana]